MRQIEVTGPDGTRILGQPLQADSGEKKDEKKPMLPLATRGVAWCDIEDDETDHQKTTVDAVKVEQSPKNKRKPRKMKERLADATSPVNQGRSTQLRPAADVQVTLGDLGLHCTAWSNQATAATAPAPSSWPQQPQKPLELMSTAPITTAPIEKRTSPVFLPPGAFQITSPMAGGKHLGDASSRMVTGTSPNMQYPDPIRFLPPGSPANGMAPTPKALWDASCRTPVNTPMAMSWPDSPQSKAGPGPWSPQAADALRVLFGNAVPSGEELAARLQAAAPESYED